MEREEMVECVPLELESCNCTETEESLIDTEEDTAQSHLSRSQNNRNKRFSIMVEEDLLRWKWFAVFKKLEWSVAGMAIPRY